MALAVKKLENFLPASFTAPGLSEREFLELCAKFPDDMVEYEADGTVTVMPPRDPKSGRRGKEVVKQLANWADVNGGEVGGPDTGYRFRDGSRLAPDASWYDEKRFGEAERPGVRFPVFAPEFVIEVRSPGDRVRGLLEKMEVYIANGVKLGWLIDPIERTVTIYRPNRRPKVFNNPGSIEGEGPVAGFVLDLARVMGA